MEQVIEKRIVIRAKAETAFRALTESRSLARWFANRAESKAVEGGSLLLMWGTGEQVEGARATFTRLVPGREVSLQWVSKIKPGETIAVTGQHSSTFRIDPSPEGVIVTMRYMADPAPADSERMKMDQDWDQAMVSLKALCEGPDAPLGAEGAGAGAGAGAGGAGGSASRMRSASGMDADPIERVRVVATSKPKKATKPKKAEAAAKPKAKPKKKAVAKKSAKPKKKAAAKAKKTSAKKPAKKPVKSAARRVKPKAKSKPKSKAKPKPKAKSKPKAKKKAAAKSAKKVKKSKKPAKKSAKKAKKR